MAFYSLAFDHSCTGTQAPAYHVAGAAAGAAGGSFRLVEVYVGGRDTSSTPYAFAINRPTVSGSTAAGTATPAPLDNYSGAAAFLAYGTQGLSVTYGTAPTPNTYDVLNFGFNSYGGQVRWAALPGAEVVAVATTNVAGTGSGANLLLGITRSANTATLSGHFIIEQR